MPDYINSGLTTVWLLGGTTVGLLYFFFWRFKARKKKEWRQRRAMDVVAEWGEWLLSIVVLLVILVAVIAACARK